MAADFVRRCPSCDTENPAESMRCVCGTMLLGVDISPRQSAVQARPASSVTGQAAGTQLCPYADCGQANPHDASHCVYCARALHTSLSSPAERQLSAATDDNLLLPPSLAVRYKPIKNLPTHGAEADLVLVESRDSGELRLVKLYRVGLAVNAAVAEHIEQIPLRHRLASSNGICV